MEEGNESVIYSGLLSDLVCSALQEGDGKSVVNQWGQGVGVYC